MRNLILLLWRYNFLIYFVLLEIFCFYLIVQYNNYQKSSFINFSGQLAGKTYESLYSVSSYIGLKKKNENLAFANALLRTRLENRILNNARMHAGTDATADTAMLQQYEYINAFIINNSTNKRNNYLTLNKGKRHGITTEMAVISDDGIVGIVNGVSKNYCSVMSVLHKDSRISARLKGSDYIGSLLWEGNDPQAAILKEIPTHVKLSKGDSIVTSSYSAIFPTEVMIGTIKDFKPMPTRDFYSIEVLLSVNFQNLSAVYIVKNLMQDEQRQLESENVK